MQGWTNAGQVLGESVSLVCKVKRPCRWGSWRISFGHLCIMAETYICARPYTCRISKFCAFSVAHDKRVRWVGGADNLVSSASCKNDHSLYHRSPHHELTPSNNLPLTTESLDTSSAGPNATANEDMTSTCKAVTRANKADKWGEESFQKEIDKWEEFYDDMKAYLTDDTVPTKSQSNIVKHSTSFSLGPDNTLYHRKLLRDSPAILQLPVVRSYEERMQVCRTIHLSTGEEGIHHRRDTMLELLGQQYYWKGQRRDVCQCVS